MYLSRHLLHQLLALFIISHTCLAITFPAEGLGVKAEYTNDQYPLGGASSSSGADSWQHTISLADYDMRITSTASNLCDPSVRQLSGYLDVTDGRHIFFWFFEARNRQPDTPLLLWLNGGPGCSSIANGLLLEHGPCVINTTDMGESTVYNENSWNEIANIIYLDQPAGTGYSYSSDGSKVDTHIDLAKDVYAFLQMFFARYPEYLSAPFHVAAESWGGHFAPVIADLIYRMNQNLASIPRDDMVKINLQSLILANGFTDPTVQFPAHVEYVCGAAPYPVFDPSGAVCSFMRSTLPNCMRLMAACRRLPSRATCLSAQSVCWDIMFSPPFLRPLSSKNQYDIRKECEESNTGLCYKAFDYIESWINREDVKTALGVNLTLHATDCTLTIQQDFKKQAQAVEDSVAYIPELVNGGVRLLAFAGDVDAACNYIGIERWMVKLDHAFHTEFEHAPLKKWRTGKSTSAASGEIRSVGAGAGNVSFIRVYEAGHMAPYDQPEASLELITKWLRNEPFDTMT